MARSLKKNLVEMSGFRVTKDLGRYLRVPLSFAKGKGRSMQYVVERVKKRLAGWKINCLSLAGRVTLAKSVMGAIPIYPMMISSLPKAVRRSANWCADGMVKVGLRLLEGFRRWDIVHLKVFEEFERDKMGVVSGASPGAGLS